MNAEGLYKLIHSLSPTQKANFTNYIATGKGRQSNYKLLFDRMSRARSYDEQKIRGKEFANPTKFFQNREALLDKLIQSLVFFTEDKISVRSYVEQALRMNAFDLARKRLLSELELAQGGEDIDYLSYLFSLKHRIEQAYRIEIPLPEGVQAPEKARARQDALARLRTLRQRLAEMIRSNRGQSSDLGPQTVEAELDSISLEDQEARYQAAKIRSGIALLRMDPAQAYHYQDQAVQELENAQFPYAATLLIKDYYLLVQFALQSQDEAYAREVIFKFSRLETRNLKEEELKQEFWAKVTLNAAVRMGNLSLVQEALPHLRAAVSRIKKESFQLGLFQAALVHFLHESYSETLSLLGEIRSVRKSKWPDIYWATEALRLLANYEMGHQDVCDPLYRATLRFAKLTGRQYPVTVTKALMKVIREPQGRLQRAAASNWKDQSNNFSQQAKEKAALDLFDLSFWFKSKAAAMSFLNAFLETGEIDNKTNQKRLG